MKRIVELSAPVGVSIYHNSTDPHVRPVLVRMREGLDYQVIFYIEQNDHPMSPSTVNLGLHTIMPGQAYPSTEHRYFSSCLTPDGTGLVHALYAVHYATTPSRVTQPELPGPAGPPGPAGMPAPLYSPPST